MNYNQEDIEDRVFTLYREVVNCPIEAKPMSTLTNPREYQIWSLQTLSDKNIRLEGVFHNIYIVINAHICPFKARYFKTIVQISGVFKLQQLCFYIVYFIVIVSKWGEFKNKYICLEIYNGV